MTIHVQQINRESCKLIARLAKEQLKEQCTEKGMYILFSKKLDGWEIVFDANNKYDFNADQHTVIYADESIPTISRKIYTALVQYAQIITNVSYTY
jgi:hypothetical protein